MKDIVYNLEDVIIGRPHPFTLGGRQFYLYPVTLAKMFLLRRQVDSLGINKKLLGVNPFFEAMRLVRENKDVCCQILSYHTCPNTYHDLYVIEKFNERKDFFMQEMESDDMASRLINLRTADQTEQFIKQLGLEKERERMAKVTEIKEKNGSGTNITFNGISVMGSFIQPLMEMGFTDDEILYEKGYTYLRLRMADKVTSIYLTEEERQNVPTALGGGLLDANNPESFKELAALMGKQGVKAKQK